MRANLYEHVDLSNEVLKSFKRQVLYPSWVQRRHQPAYPGYHLEAGMKGSERTTT